MSEYRMKIGDFAPTGPVDSKFQVEGVAPTSHSFFQKAKWSVMWYKNAGTRFFRFATNHAFDRQTDRQANGRTDRQTKFSSLNRVCIPCSAVKIVLASERQQ